MQRTVAESRKFRIVGDDNDGETVFIPRDNGSHRYVVMRHDPQWYVDYLDALLYR